MSWFWLTLVFMVFMAGADVISKKTVGTEKLDEVVFGGSVQLGVGVLCLILAVMTGWKFEFNITSVWQFVIMMVTYVIAVSLYFTGLKRVDLSLAAILVSSGMVWAWIMGRLMLGELITMEKVISGILILMAILVIFWKKERVQIRKYEYMLIAAAFFNALGAMWDKKLNSFGNPLTYIGLSFFLVGIAILAFFAGRTSKAMVGTFRMPVFWRAIAVNGLAYSAAFFALFRAYNLGGEASTMFTMTQGVSVLVTIAGIILLRERDDLVRKLVAAFLMTGGIFALGIR